MPEAKPYDIPKQLVWAAYQRVKANQGAAGVDGETLAMFEKDLKGNLYKVWNRMSSGSYFPPPVRLVEIPKGNGGTRPLGIPTVGDRVAQTVVKMVLEPIVEPVFHPDSYGYRPGRSALDAVEMARTRCWRSDWIIDLDIKGFFDALVHDLVERAVAHHTDSKWVRLYIARWLRAPVQKPDGALEQRTKGTPQGGVVSPLTQVNTRGWSVGGRAGAFAIRLGGGGGRRHPEDDRRAFIVHLHAGHERADSCCRSCQVSRSRPCRTRAAKSSRRPETARSVTVSVSFSSALLSSSRARWIRGLRRSERSVSSFRSSAPAS